MPNQLYRMTTNAGGNIVLGNYEESRRLIEELNKRAKELPEKVRAGIPILEKIVSANQIVPCENN